MIADVVIDKRLQGPSGIVLLDKPSNCTSQHLITHFKKKFHLKKTKIGHTGTLDPLATGLLPLLLGEATKFAQFLLKAEKVYEVSAQLGQKTNTGDSDGEVTTEAPIPEDWTTRLPHILPTFQGSLQQTPPAFSALRHQGVRLYRLARAGKAVTPPTRTIQILSVTLVDIAPERGQFTLRISCGPGTYVRSFIEDLGEALGTVAHVIKLRREQVGVFSVAAAHRLESLSCFTPEVLLPVDGLLSQFPSIALDAEVCQRLQMGQRVPNTAEEGTWRFYDPMGHFLGLLEAKAGVLHPLRLLSTGT